MAPVVKPARRAISWTPARSNPFSAKTSAAAASRRSRVGSSALSETLVTSLSKTSDYGRSRRWRTARSAATSESVRSFDQTVEHSGGPTAVDRRPSRLEPCGQIVGDTRHDQPGRGVEADDVAPGALLA